MTQSCLGWIIWRREISEFFKGLSIQDYKEELLSNLLFSFFQLICVSYSIFSIHRLFSFLDKQTSRM